MSGETGTVLRCESASDDDGQAVDVVVDMGGGQTNPAELALPPGDDSKPLPGDKAALADGPSAGSKRAVAFFDTVTESKSAPGEKRIYGRDADGNTVCEIWWKNSGEIKITNFRAQPIHVHGAGAVIIESDASDLRLNKGGRPMAAVGDFAVGSIKVADLAAAVLAPSPSGSFPIAVQITSGIRGIKGG